MTAVGVKRPLQDCGVAEFLMDDDHDLRRAEEQVAEGRRLRDLEEMGVDVQVVKQKFWANFQIDD